MYNESALRTNNLTSLGEWLENDNLMPEHRKNAVIWPKAFNHANSIRQDTDIERIMVTSDTAHSRRFEQAKDVREENLLSYELAERVPGQIDLEYAWAVADDTIRRGLRADLTAEEGMRKVADTSEKLLRPGGVAVYNLESAGGRLELDYENQLEFAEAFGEILEEDYNTTPEIYESPEMNDSNTHLVWQKQQ